MNVGDKVLFRGEPGYEIVARTEDGRAIVDGVEPSNLLEGNPFIVANEAYLDLDMEGT